MPPPTLGSLSICLYPTFVRPGHEPLLSSHPLPSPLLVLILRTIFTLLFFHLLREQYDEDLKTKRDGELDAPITIMGPKSAVIRGKSGDSIMEINHDFIHLEGFSIDGSG